MNTITKNIILSPFNLLYNISPEMELKLMFWLKQGYKLNLKNPKTYNEKLQWIKLYDKNEWMPKCCDKYAVREYINLMGCGELLNKLLWHGKKASDIPWDVLPQQFVIKVTHGSTFNIIVQNKNVIDRVEISKKLDKWLKAKFIPCYGEWFYGKAEPRIIIEEFLNDGRNDGLLDYKVYCFNGTAKLIAVYSGRYTELKTNIYSTEWIMYPDVYFKGRHIDEKIPCPKVLPEMLMYAEKLSSSFTHARVDFYIVNDRIYFGELTFTTGAGFDHITPRVFDEEMGSWLDLKLDRDSF